MHMYACMYVAVELNDANVCMPVYWVKSRQSCHETLCAIMYSGELITPKLLMHSRITGFTQHPSVCRASFLLYVYVYISDIYSHWLQSPKIV